MFVSVKTPSGDIRGLAKLVGHEDAFASVEFFDAPTLPPRMESVDLRLVEPITLPEQTRLYHFNEGLQAWRIGRLIDDHGDSQFIKFPNGQSAILPVADVFVRCAAPIADPTPFLAAKITETPRFADARSAFVRSIVAQRGASIGMSALLSSAIELEAHQVEVVRRVLQDPVQRYLLADEVGLGKTIEAGILIRQCFLDGDPETQVVVLAPAALVPQWREELARKFYLGERIDSSLHVLSLDQERLVLRHLPNATMLVVDEAHHLRRDGGGGRPAFFDQVAAAAAHLDRVLLLSATPALHNTRGFLEMLHLLDPQTYRLGDEAALQERIKSRQALAEIVASLTPDNALYLDHPLDQLVNLFPDDALLQEQVQTLRTQSDAMPEEDDPAFVEALSRVRAHLSELYRLHRRVLRHRRRAIGGLTPDRAGAEVVDYESAETADLLADLEAWRVEDLASAGLADRAAGATVFRNRLEQHFEHTVAAVAPTLAGTTDRGERIAARLGGAEAFQARLAALADGLRARLGPRRQFIVFCSDPASADQVAAGLAAALGVPVDRHDPRDTAWQAFGVDPNRPILVCDRRAEEGLNLQGGRKTIVHWDLPLDPNRVEQRMGRADRYGSGDRVQSLLLRGGADPYEAAWIDYLDTGLEVFSRSIASLQYLIDEALRDLPMALLEAGAECFIDLTQASAGPQGLIAHEIRSLDQQDTLDALGVPPSALVDSLSEVDGDWRGLERDIGGWLETTLMFRRTRRGADGDALESPFRYEYVTQQPHTLVPLDAFFTRCREAIDATPAPHRTRAVRTYPSAYRRQTVLSRPGRDLGARLLRYGDPLLSGMYDLAQADDRGRSTALWRFVPNHKSESLADVYFRFDFMVEADLAASLEVLAQAGRLTPAAEAAIRRRGDMALGPSFHTLWLDAERREVDGAELLAVLSSTYRAEATDGAGRDFNLNPQRWKNVARLDLPALVDWPASCQAARETAEAELRLRPVLTKDLDAAARAAAAADYGRLAQLRTRADRTGDAGEHAEVDLEVALSEALLAGIRQPRVHLDGLRAVFLSGELRALPIVDARA
jgi:ATP-dependent helicase HepA